LPEFYSERYISPSAREAARTLSRSSLLARYGGVMGSATTGRPGRPRAFEIDEALDRAVEVFWRQGFEGTTLSDLTEAMGISRPSMYAAFGSKEALFERALDRYSQDPGSYGQRALDEPTALRSVHALLHGAVDQTTRSEGPVGCLEVQGCLVGSRAATPARTAAATSRERVVRRLQGRLERAQLEGDLPEKADPALLARYVVTVAHGISVQAAGGASAAELHRVADVALKHWPLA